MIFVVLLKDRTEPVYTSSRGCGLGNSPSCPNWLLINAAFGWWKNISVAKWRYHSGQSKIPKAIVIHLHNKAISVPTQTFQTKDSSDLLRRTKLKSNRSQTNETAVNLLYGYYSISDDCRTTLWRKREILSIKPIVWLISRSLYAPLLVFVLLRLQIPLTIILPQIART